MKNTRLSKAAVIGAGNMGAGIAAHLANAGVPVLLLDRVAPGGARDALAVEAVQRQLRNGGFMHPDRARLVETGNVEDDLHRIADADWIVEAVFEDVQIKRDLYERLDALRKDGSIVSSNTSTIPLAHLTEGMSDRFAQDFVVTHFFNPPRVMKLLELVGGKTAGAEDVLQRAEVLCDQVLGKTVIRCRDTPGFIANRVGNYWMSVAVLEAKALGLSVEEADAVMSAPFGIPHTGIFGLFDYVGINLVPLVWGSFMRTLSPNDAHRRHNITQDSLLLGMMERGWTGRAAGAGFYRTSKASGKTVREVMDLVIGEYRAARPVELASLATAGEDLRKLCEQGDRGGRYAWQVLSHVVAYAAEVGPEIADDVDAIDVAMRLGYNWSQGPFELADRVGVQWIADRLRVEGRPVPPLLASATARGGFRQGEQRMTTAGAMELPRVAAGVLSLSSVKGTSTRVAGNDAASLWDIGEGVLALEVHTKMNACNQGVVEVFEAAPGHVRAGFRSLVVANDHARAFSVGADLASFVAMVRARQWAALTEFVTRGQTALRGLRNASFPVVAAPFGLTLGGGCEIQLHADASVAHAELNAGLPELKVGILPGWGGCMRLLERWTARSGGDATVGAARAFDVLVAASASSSALQARDLGLLREDDPITMNRDRLLVDARAHAIALHSADYRPALPGRWQVRGAAGADDLMKRIERPLAEGTLSANDALVARMLARVLTGGDVADGSHVTDTEVLALEVAGMVELAHGPSALARMEHMLAKGKPLGD